MKKNLLCISVLMLLVITACTNKPTNTFSITGKIENADGQPVYFVYYNNDDAVSDTAIVSNGKFIFEGTVDPLGRKGFIEYGEPSSEYAGDNRLYLYFSPGETILEIGTGRIADAETKGSPLQDTYNEYQELRSEVDAKYEAYSDSAKLFPEIKEMYYSKVDSMFKLGKKIQIEYIKENPASFVAYDLLTEYHLYDHIPLEELESIYENLSPEIKDYDKRVKQCIVAKRATAPGMPAPELKGVDPTRNTEVKLSDLKGKYVLIDFWATWCHGCVLGLPHVRSLYEKYNADGLEVVALSKDHNMNAWKNFIKENEYMQSFYNILAFEDITVDDSGNFVNDSMENSQDRHYNISFIPVSFLIDRDGNIVDRYDHINDLDAKLVEIFGK